MKAVRRGLRRLVGAITRSRYDYDFAEEIKMHIEMQADDNLKLGMSPEEARRAAMLKFGGIESARESYRDQHGLPWIELCVKDIRYAFRSIFKNPAFAAAAILSLALGIGITTAIFSIADSVLFRPLPYAHPEQLATISVNGAVSASLYEAFRTEAHSIESAALFTNWNFDLAGQGEPERIPAARVSAELFQILGVMPELGRTFTKDEDRVGNENVVVISDGLWKRKFGADPQVIGRTVTLNSAAHTVVGVMPPGFRFPEGPEHTETVGPFPPADTWRPMALSDGERTCKGCFNFGMLVRLQPDVTVDQARVELSAILNRQDYPSALLEMARQRGLTPGLRMLNLQSAVTGKVRIPIMVLFGAVSLALLIACVNVATLLLARGLRHREEMAIRQSLGATRGRLIQQGLAQAFAITICSSALAVLMAWAAVRAFVMIAPASIPRLQSTAVDIRMLGFALFLTLITTALSGTAPAIFMANSTPDDALKMGRRTATAAPTRLRAALIVAEFALSLVLLLGCGLLAKTFVVVSSIPLGFRTDNLLTMRTSLPRPRYDNRSRPHLIEQVVSNCSALPGVISAAATSALPLTGESEGWGLLPEGGDPNRDKLTLARVRAITPGYFRTLGIRLISGREFSEKDRGTNPVAIISKSAAKEIWPTITNPLGQRVMSGPKMSIEIVGIVDDTHASGIDAEVRPYLYLPFWQFAPSEFAVAIRSAVKPTTLIEDVKSEIHRIDKYQPVTDVATMERIVSDSISPRRFPVILMVTFAIFALLLTAVGTYGVLSYSVAQRAQEIGIRIALGSTRWQVVAGVAKQAFGLAMLGIIIGLLVSVGLVPLLGSMLYGVDFADTSVFSGCVALSILVAAAASVIPAYDSNA